MEIKIEPGSCADAEAILALQRLAYQSEAELYGDWSIPPLTQTLDSLCDELASDMTFLCAKAGGALVGSVRAKLNGGVCEIGRLMVHPDYQGRGIGSALLCAIEAKYSAAARYELFTGDRSAANLRLYQRQGYVVTHSKRLSQSVNFVYLSKAPREGL
jgi:GNAT superfamily N-acetyltransferase